jgi:transporter family-2 protein
MKLILLLVVVVVGMLQPIQAGMNAEFRRHAAHPFQAGIVNMIGGAIAFLVLLLLLRLPPPGPATLAKAPWWSLLGGLAGGTIVVTMLVAAPKLGAALLIGAFVLGQMLSSAIIDHGGLIGYPERSVSPMRIGGIAVLLVGVLLIERSG